MGNRLILKMSVYWGIIWCLKKENLNSTSKKNFWFSNIFFRIFLMCFYDFSSSKSLYVNDRLCFRVKITWHVLRTINTCYFLPCPWFSIFFSSFKKKLKWKTHKHVIEAIHILYTRMASSVCLFVSVLTYQLF